MGSDRVRWRQRWTPLVFLAAFRTTWASHTGMETGIEQELEDMQVTLLQAKIQLGRVLVETDERRDLGSSASTSEFLRGVEQLEARVTALSSRLERMKTRTPWFFQPFDCLVGIVRKMGDFLGDLVLHPRSFAWQQLGVFCLCLAGVCVGALQLKQHRFLSDKTAGASATAMGLSIGLASVFVAGAICHPLIPWLLIIVWCWIHRATRPML